MSYSVIHASWYSDSRYSYCYTVALLSQSMPMTAVVLAAGADVIMWNTEIVGKQPLYAV